MLVSVSRRAANARRRSAPAVILVALLLVLTACGTTGPSAPAASATPGAAAAQPVVIDTDLGADDLIALALLLPDHSLDVRAVTVAATGLGHCQAGRQTLNNLFHQLQVEPLPVGCGRDDPGPDGRTFPREWRIAADTAYGLRMAPVAVGGERREATEVLDEAIRAVNGPVTVVELGPWTNLEDLFAASPDLVTSVAQIHAMGGTVDAPGNVYDDQGTPLEPSLEWNLAADPSAFAAVHALDVPIRLVSLDTTDQVPLDGPLYERLDADHAAAGANLAFELLTRNTYLFEGGTFLWDELAALALLDPSLLDWSMIELSVDAAGHLSRGGDRSIEVSTDVDPSVATDALMAGLTSGGARADAFELAGVLDVTWDGTSCALDVDALRTGLYRVRFTNETDTDAVGILAAVASPHGWDELIAFLPEAEEGSEPPEWLTVQVYSGAPANSTGMGIGQVGEGIVGPVCIRGDGADVNAVAGDPIEVGS